MVILSHEIIGFINVFERSTRAKVKDCFMDDETLVFVVQPGQIRKALGPKGVNIRKLGALYKKRLRIIEFNHDPKRFISNLIYPIRAEEITLEDNVVKIKAANMREKGQIFGRDKSNLRKIQKLVSKYFSDLKIELE